VKELPEPPRIYIDDKPLKSPTAAFIIASLRHFSVVTAQGSRRIVSTAHQLHTRLPILLFLLDMNQIWGNGHGHGEGCLALPYV